ncbi:Quinone oxidoreductase [Labilithrix luteola]|uniref:Quinone oxidoreductase n=1 Tax=Labilithrix luteola TaxID=1391654 RepID=A0A0K1PQF3_9BACT|nr:zinc-binding dehydrogenase [Labilithrix luteola]AKU95621.1 Quinone oxidoreductase [Labilithrix luteola]
MKTHEIVIPGPNQPLQIRERELGSPGAGEASIATEATGVSFAEVQMLGGRYPGQPAFPFVPGYDLVGKVLSVGPGVDPALVGKRVATMTQTGAWAENVLRRAEELVVVPDDLDPSEVDTLIVNGITAYKMLHRVARVKAGQTIVVHGAGGGVGTILVQLAKLAGVHVIGTCKPSQREAVERLGARVVDYTRGKVLDDTRALAPEGVDAVFDHVGGDSLRASFAMLRRGGTLVSYGSASTINARGSAWTPILVNMARALLWSLRPGGRTMKVFDVWGRGSFGADSAFRPRRFWREFREDLGRLLALFMAGSLRAQVARRVPLLDASTALEAHVAGGFTGKIVLETTARFGVA